MTPEEEQFKDALVAVYERAYRQGYRKGFAAGTDDKQWLHKSWPLFTLSIGMLTMIAGMWIGWAA